MTGEEHTIILKLALRTLMLERSDEQLQELYSWLTRDKVQWCLEHPDYPRTVLEGKMDEFIERTLSEAGI